MNLTSRYTIDLEICWVIKDFTMPKGILLATYFPKTKNLNNRNLLADLGDYEPGFCRRFIPTLRKIPKIKGWSHEKMRMLVHNN